MINQAFIDDALHRDHSIQVSIVAKTIRHNAYQHGYVSQYYNPKCQYLQKSHLHKALTNMGYSQCRADYFFKWIRENVQHAYERGVFVVTDRVLHGINFSADTPEALLSGLRDAEKTYFTSTLWYEDDAYTNCLRHDNWHHDIVNEISKLTLRYSRAAFTQGMKDACKRLVKENDKTDSGATNDN